MTVLLPYLRRNMTNDLTASFPFVSLPDQYLSRPKLKYLEFNLSCPHYAGSVTMIILRAYFTRFSFSLEKVVNFRVVTLAW